MDNNSPQKELANPIEKPLVVTAAQPTGKLHLGNYLGAVKHWKTFLLDSQCFFGVVDMHAITTPHIPAQLRKHSLECVAQYIAAGLDPEKCTIFLQSQVIGHTELAWILGCQTPIGELQRMTQFKDKSSSKDIGFIGSGLLYYPILMAADILLYNAQKVPVGEDQKQHLELARNLAERFNHYYSETFHLPEPIIPQTGFRIRSLRNPDRKMSKSDPNPSGIISLLDPPEVLRKKIMSAVTDSGSQIIFHSEKLGVSNLLTILSIVTDKKISYWENYFQSKNYGALKKEVFEALEGMLSPIRQQYQELIKDQPYLQSVLKEGAETAQKKAYKTLKKVYRKVGFLEKF